MAAIGPSARGDVVMLDLGANVQCDARNLVRVRGDGRRVRPHRAGPDRALDRPAECRVGGAEGRRHACARRPRSCAHSPIGPQFHGFVEGHDITAGTTDVVVTDGFTGNVALKTGEGALKLIGDLLRQVFTSSIAARLGYLLARPGLDRLREWLDPRRYNGAVMLGLNGVVVKSHGGTDAQGFAHAVDVAMDMVVHRFNDHIREGLTRIDLDKRAAAGAERRQARASSRTGCHCPTGRRCALRSIIAGVGGYLPERVVTNDELATHAWRPPTTGSASAPASASATSPARTRPRRSWAPRRRAPRWPMPAPSPAEVDAIILATATPDQAFPATALRVQAALGVPSGFGFDLVGGLRRVHLRAVGGRRA